MKINLTRSPDRLAEIVRRAAASGVVVPAFNVRYLPALEPIASTLAKHNTFGMVEVARLEILKFQSRGIAEVAEEYRRVADPSLVNLHLDHIPAVDEDGLSVDWEPLIAEGISQGYSSVMIDASRLPLPENISITSQVVRMAHAAGVLVEAELGAVLGHELGPVPPYEELFASKKGFTDPDDAKIFAEKTGVDWLSVSVGSVHGPIALGARDRAKVQARIDIEHLRKLRDATGIPLVLHGGSGISHSCLNEAARNGIAKINIGTDVGQPYERVLAAGGNIQQAQAAVAEVVDRLICEVFHIEGSASRLSAVA